MTMSRAYLRLLAQKTFVLVLLSAAPSLCSQAKPSSTSAFSAVKLRDELPAPAVLVSRGDKDHTLVGDSSFMGKVDPANSMIACFFKSRFPFFAWPFPKYPPVPVVQPASPSVPNTSPGAEQSEKLPSSPSTGTGTGMGMGKGNNSGGGNP